MLLLFLIFFEVLSHFGIHGYGPPFRVQNSLPSFTNLFKLNNADGSTTYEVCGCKIIQSNEEGCIKKFKPDQSCFKRLSLSYVFNILWEGNTLETMTKSIFPPGVFAVKEFVINTCNEDKIKKVKFVGELVESKVINVINDKMQITSGELTFKFDWQKFNFASIEFTIKGKIKIANQVIDVEVEKKQKNSSYSVQMVAEKIKAKDFSNFFLKTEVDLGLFSEMLIEKSEIKIERNEDNSYEVFINGKASGIPGLEEVVVLLVIKKPNNGDAQVGVAASLKQVKPLEVISAFVRKISNIIENKNKEIIEIIESHFRILKDLELDLSVEYASNDIEDFKNDEIKKQISSLIPDHPEKLLNGTIISLNIPVTKIIEKIGSPVNLSKPSPNMLFQISIKDKIISFKFPSNMFSNGLKILETLAPVAFTFLKRYILESNFKIRLKKYDVNIKKKELKISISIPRELSLRENFLVLQNTRFTLKLKKKKHEFHESFSLKAKMKLGESLLNISADKNEDNITFKGSVESLNFEDIAKFFNIDFEYEYFPKFKVKNFKINAVFGQDRKLSITGKVSLFDWKSIHFEFIKFNNNEKSKRFNVFSASKHNVMSTNQSNSSVNFPIFKGNNFQDLESDGNEDESGDTHESPSTESIPLNHLVTKRHQQRGNPKPKKGNSNNQEASDVLVKKDVKKVLVMLMKGINLQSFIKKILKKDSLSTNWLTLDISFVYSNSEITKTETEKLFTTNEIKEAVQEVSNGIIFHGKMMLPKSNDSCYDTQSKKYDELCRFAVTTFGNGSSLSVKAGYKDNKFFFEASFDTSLKLGKVVIKSVIVGLKLENSIPQIYICGKFTLQIDNKDVDFNAFISLDFKGELTLGGEMNEMVENMLGIRNFALSDLCVSVSLQLPFTLTSFTFSGMVVIGENKTKENFITIQIAFGIDIGSNNYFYGYADMLTLGRITTAFGYELTSSIPQNVIDSGVTNLKVAYSTTEKEITFRNQKIELHPRLLLAGNINILGFQAYLDVQISLDRLFILCEVDTLEIAGGVLSLTRSLTEKNLGPKICIDTSSNSKQIYIAGAVSVFGVSAAVEIDISNKKMEFSVAGSLYKMTAHFSVSSTYKNTLKDSLFKVSARLSSIDDADTEEANKILKEAADKTDKITKAIKNLENKRSRNYKELVSSKELLSNIEEKLFETMTTTYNKIEQYQSKIENSCTLKCQNEIGYFSKSWCSSNCLLDKGERSIRVEASKKRQEVRTMFTLLPSWSQVKNMFEYLYNTAKSFITDILNTDVNGIKIQDMVDVGMKLLMKGATYVKEKGISAIQKFITINLICFEASLDSQFNSELIFKTNVSLLGSNYVHDIKGKIEFGFVKMIAKKITEILYPGIEYIAQSYDSVMNVIRNELGILKKLNHEKILKEAEIKKLKKDVDKDNADEEILQDDKSDEFTTKNNINRNITIDEIKRQIYNERHVVSLTDGDVLDALDIYPDYTLDINFAKNESVDISDLTHQMINEKNNCKLAQGLVRNYEKISDELNEVMTFLDNQKELHKKQCLYENHKFNSLEKTAIEKCKRAKCNEKQREKLVHLAHSLSQAHVMRTEKLDEAFEAIGKRLIKNEKEMMTRNIKSSGMNMKRFLSKLKHSTKSASSLPSSTNEHKLRLNASYKAVRDLLQSDQPYQDVVQSFQLMKSNLVFLRENIPCAA